MKPSIHPPPRVRKKKRGVGLALETDFAQIIIVGVGEGWQENIPTQELVVDVPYSVDLDDWFTGDPPTYSVISGSLPAGLSLSGARNNILSGTPTTAATYTPTIRATSSDADWAARSTAAGVIVANRLDTQAIIDDWLLPNGYQDHLSLETTIKPHASAGGCLKFAVLNTDGTDSGQLSVPFGTTFGEGDTIWFSFRVWCVASEIFQAWKPTAGNSEADNAAKFCILSRDGNGVAPTGSNQSNEYVFQTAARGEVQAYRQPSFEAISVNPFPTACNASDYSMQPEIDRGANPLSGVNCDTGSAWSSCDQDRARYSSWYSEGNAAEFRVGFGDPFCGSFKPRIGEWTTITGCLTVTTWGASTNRMRGWAAHDGEPYQLLWDEQRDIGDANSPDYNGFNLMPYVSFREAGGRHVSSRQNNITGVTIHCVGNDTATGDGVLEYNATTQRFRWHGNGETFGSAAGFSAANNILWRNVCAASPNLSFLLIEIDPDNLPSSGTITDTVTIATGRADTARYYCDVIISTQAINAPGGYAPP